LTSTKILARIIHTRKEENMFEIGDIVKIGENGEVGKITEWFYDEGNVWVVKFGEYEMLCSDSMLSII
jgi:hypothetical protein